MKKNLVDLIVETINSGEWTYSSHKYKHTSGLAIWHANGVFSIETYPEESGFSILEKIRIQNAFKSIGRKRAIELLSTTLK